jgi:hypothetical protein
MDIERSRTNSRKQKGIVSVYGWRFVACGVAVLLTLQTSIAVAAPQEPSQQQPAAPAQQPRPSSTQPDAPPPMPVVNATSGGTDSTPSAPVPQSSTPAQQPATPQHPVGTAAAPYEKPSGVAGSRPAGAAIAPAKQRRVRAIVIKVGIVLAAGAAVGAVVGLSKASHSQPQ